MHWVTPLALFERLNEEFRFDWDVCATADNAKCYSFFSPEDDGLDQNWDRMTCWMNPPYGRGIGAWMQKAYESSQAGATVVALIPSRTNPPWFHDWVLNKAAEIRIIRSKVPFVGPKKGVPFWGSLLAIYRPKWSGETKWISWTQPKLKGAR